MHAKALNAFWEGGGGRGGNVNIGQREVEKITLMYVSPMSSCKIIIGPINIEHSQYNPLVAANNLLYLTLYKKNSC